MARAKQRKTQAKSAAKSQQQTRPATPPEKIKGEAQPTVGSTTKNVRKSLGMPNRKKRRSWLFATSVILFIVIAIGAFVFVRLQQDNAQRQGETQAIQTLTTLDPQLLTTVGAGGVTTTMHAIKDAPALKGAHDKPLVLYVGREACKACAAQRWPIIIALSRFGKFEKLTPLISTDGHIATFTFYKSTYTSQYLDFAGIETYDNQTSQPQQLDHLTATQQEAYNKYGQPPYIDQSQVGTWPFLDIANQQVSYNAYFDASPLSQRSYQEILDLLKDTNSDLTRGIFGSANYLTAAICVATNNQPASVCTTAPIPEIQKNLPKPEEKKTDTTA
jgi:hypothetical protein